MKRYIAFLRGINISGKNRVPMAELKVCFEELGLADVNTYLNSGNVAFSSQEDDVDSITSQLEQVIRERFSVTIPVLVISQKDLEDVLRHAPQWWGNEDKEIYNNLIFIMKPATFQEVIKEIGDPKEGLEQIQDYQQTIFWSFSRKEYQKTNWWSKTASANISYKLTIRTAGTVRKICGM